VAPKITSILIIHHAPFLRKNYAISLSTANRVAKMIIFDQHINYALKILWYIFILFIYILFCSFYFLNFNKNVNLTTPEPAAPDKAFQFLTPPNSVSGSNDTQAILTPVPTLNTQLLTQNNLNSQFQILSQGYRLEELMNSTTNIINFEKFFPTL
jgi:hypothetical protein